MKFVIDAQLPPSLADWLRGRGEDAEHVEDAGLREADDVAIFRYADANNALLVSKDGDFALLSAKFAVQVLWIRTGNASNDILFQRLDGAWPRIRKYLEDGVQLVECR